MLQINIYLFLASCFCGKQSSAKYRPGLYAYSPHDKTPIRSGFFLAQIGKAARVHRWYNRSWCRQAVKENLPCRHRSFSALNIADSAALAEIYHHGEHPVLATLEGWKPDTPKLTCLGLTDHPSPKPAPSSFFFLHRFYFRFVCLLCLQSARRVSCPWRNIAR